MTVGCKPVALLQLRAAGGMSLTMANTEVLAHKGAVAAGEITAKYLLRSILVRSVMWGANAPGKERDTIQLVPVQVFGARIALATAFVCTFELAI